MSQPIILEAEVTEDRQLRVELPAGIPQGPVVLTLAPSPAVSAPTNGKNAAPQDRAEKLGALLQMWMDDDPEEQKKEVGELLRALDEDRLSERKLFPPDLEGITW